MRTLARVLPLALVFLTVFIQPTQARPTEPVFDRHAVNGFGSSEPITSTRKVGLKQILRKRERRAKARGQGARQHNVARYRVARSYSARRTKIASRGEVQILPHPPGCPPRSFCGCGVALHIFGKAVAYGGLAVAANWLSFPRAEPGPGKVAARRGHVFAILANRGRGMVLAYDPNSGRRLTRVHLRSLRGYTVVDPRAGRSRYADAAG